MGITTFYVHSFYRLLYFCCVDIQLLVGAHFYNKKAILM